MYSAWTAALLGMTLAASALASFETDVVLRVGRQLAGASPDSSSQGRLIQMKAEWGRELLAKAMPLAQLERQLAQRGIDLPQRRRDQENNNGNGASDFYDMGYEKIYSFTGFSVKYAVCQPVQYFSDEAVQSGQYSPMVTQDIVVLRLCPQASCSSKTQYGCHYNYAEYAISVTDYLDIMLRYSEKQRELACNYCNECANQQANGNRRMEDANKGQNNNNANNQNDGQQEQKNQLDCSDYKTYCSDQSACANNGDYEQIREYLGCSEAAYNDYAYYVRPRCNIQSGTIDMAIYYDQYCVQYAGKEVNITDLGLGFYSGQFATYYAGDCIDCSENNYPPYYDLNSALCNNLHAQSATCTSDLQYDLFEDNADESADCSFIESIRFGTYDQSGELTSMAANSTWDAQFTITQKVLLAVTMAVTVFFIIYACYLHHSMTNLLIRSLSHRELLPPSRQSRRRTPVKRRGGPGALNPEEEDVDWHKPAIE